MNSKCNQWGATLKVIMQLTKAWKTLELCRTRISSPVFKPQLQKERNRELLLLRNLKRQEAPSVALFKVRPKESSHT